jgi:hypothetical protein
VLLGLCNQTDLNAAVERARKAAEKAGIKIPEPQIEPEIESTSDFSDNPLAAFGLRPRGDG